MPNPRQKLAFLNTKSDDLHGNALDRRQLPSHRYFGDLASATHGAALGTGKREGGLCACGAANRI